MLVSGAVVQHFFRTGTAKNGSKGSESGLSTLISSKALSQIKRHNNDIGVPSFILSGAPIHQ
jgi:hypothetical protein